MLRLSLTLGALLCLLPSASANLSVRKASASLRAEQIRPLPPARTATPSPVRANRTPSTQDDFNVTPQTEVFVNGRPCRFDEVPEGASIIRMEVAPDRTVLTIYFRAGSK